MEDLNKANETLQKLEDNDVRIIYLPPLTVAAAHFSGKAEYGVGPEATGMVEKFVYETELLKRKPDARGMGFDCYREDLRVVVGPTPSAYEAWVSIPDNLEVKPPLVKKTFGGGMYAGHGETVVQEPISEYAVYLKSLIPANIPDAYALKPLFNHVQMKKKFKTA